MYGIFYKCGVLGAIQLSTQCGEIVLECSSTETSPIFNGDIYRCPTITGVLLVSECMLCVFVLRAYI